MKLKIALISALFLSVITVKAEVSPAVARAYVETLISEGILYWKDKPFDEQVKKFREVMETKSDLDGIAKRVLGDRLWKYMDKTQKQNYLVAFREMLLTRYSKKFSSYNGQAIVVTDATESVKRFPIGVESSTPMPQIAVISELKNSGGAPVKVEWYVGEENGKPVVTDITMAGPSMVDTEKATFAAIQRDPQKLGKAREGCKGAANLNKCIADSLLQSVMQYMAESK